MGKVLGGLGFLGDALDVAMIDYDFGSQVARATEAQKKAKVR